MGKLIPAPRGYAVQKDTITGRWYIERRETDKAGNVVNIQALRDEDGLVMLYARRSHAITDALIQAQNVENERLRARIAELEMQHTNKAVPERIVAVS